MSSLRRFAGARQKVGATVAAIVLGVGVAVVAAPLAASAHTATLSGVADCTTSTGEATITWTLENDYNELVTVTSSDNASIPVGTTVAATNGGANTTKTFTQKIAAPAANKSISSSLAFKWSGDNFVQPAANQPIVPVVVTVGKDCTVPTPTTDCVTALWEIPGGDVTKPFDQPQQLKDSKTAACGDLTVVTPPDTCKAYQVDSYTRTDAPGDKTTALLASKTLTSSAQDSALLETSVSPSYKVIAPTTTCAPPVSATADATITTTPPTCTTDGTIDFTDGLVHAHWADTTDTTDGSRTALADTNYTFKDGSTQEEVTYTVPGTKLTGSQCYPKDALASASVATNATCTSAGTIDFTSGLVNATWADTDNSDVTDGSRTADATSGHLFANGQSTEEVRYTIPAKLTNCDATASVSVATQATCSAAGTVDFTTGLVNATWDDPNDLTDGSRTATAVSGHTFADGSSTATVTYSIPSQLTNCAVTPPVTPPTTPPVVSPPTVNPPTTVTSTITKVSTPTVTPPTKTTTKTVAPTVSAPTVLASTGNNDSTPIAGSIALFALLFGAAVVVVSMRHRRKTSGE